VISAAALVALALTVVGGAGMSAALSAPILALVGVHSIGAAGGIIAGLSTVQKIYAVGLLAQVAQKAVQTGQRLQPLHEAILAKLQDDVANVNVMSISSPLQYGRENRHSVEAHHVGGPLGWGRAPVVFVYNPEHDHPIRPRH
jgi:hypothetical protein